MALPRLIIGGSQGAILAPTDHASMDDEAADVTLFALTNIIAPATPTGECIFPLLRLTTDSQDAADLVITLIVDKVRKSPHALSIDGTGVEVHEVDLREPYPALPATPKIRTAPRGSGAQIEIVGISFANITVIQLEYEPVREARKASA